LFEQQNNHYIYQSKFDLKIISTIALDGWRGRAAAPFYASMTLLQELILLNTQPAEGTLPARGLDHRIFLKIDQGRQFPLFSQIFFTVGCPFT
jgi:hypothetical protein